MIKQPAATSYTYKWKDNGNPGVPVCGTVKSTWCLKSYTLREGGVVIAVKIDPAVTQYTFPAKSGTHTYSLSINGVMGDGITIESPYLVETVNVP